VPVVTRTRTPRFKSKTIDDLVIDDERSFAHVGLYADLKEVLRRDRYDFRVLPKSRSQRWDRALFLNLTFWGNGAEGDVLVDDHLSADVVAHVAWHHLAAKAFSRASDDLACRSFGELVLCEAIASAFDVYLIGRLLGHAPRSSFLETQVSAMAETARAAGQSEAGFRALIGGVARDPERAFEDLRQLLFDAMHALRGCSTAPAALSVLTSFEGHRFGSLLHRYELSNWLLYARAYGDAAVAPDPEVRALDRTLRKAREPLEWLVSAWVRPTLLAKGVLKTASLRYERHRGPVLSRRYPRTR
jgi:hypothetical protein